MLNLEELDFWEDVNLGKWAWEGKGSDETRFFEGEEAGSGSSVDSSSKLAFWEKKSFGE